MAAESAPAEAAQSLHSLLDLPTDVLVRVVSHLDAPEDLVRLSWVCHALALTGTAGASLAPIETVLRARAPAQLAHVSTEALLLREWRERAARGGESSVVSAGEASAAFVDGEGALLTVGGLPEGVEYEYSKFHIHAAALGHGPVDRDEDDVLVARPRPIAALRGVRIVAVSSGRAHVLALSADGGAYSFGHGPFGELGLGAASFAYTPARVEALLTGGRRVVGISAGAQHSLFVAASGALFSCGHGGHGQLGHGDCSHARAPERVQALSRVRAVSASAGVRHSLVRLASGELFAFGANADGQLGVPGNSAAEPLPLPVAALRAVRVQGTAAGEAHSIALGADGRVYTWGALLGASADPAPGMAGAPPAPALGIGIPALGHGEVLVCRGEPRAVAAIGVRGARAVRVAAGCAYSLVVLDDGSVHAFGLNRAGELGVGVEGSVAEPLPVCISPPPSELADRAAQPGGISRALHAVSAACACALGVVVRNGLSFVVTADGGVWCFGSGLCWRQGYADQMDRWQPARVTRTDGGTTLTLAVAGSLSA